MSTETIANRLRGFLSRARTEITIPAEEITSMMNDLSQINAAQLVTVCILAGVSRPEPGKRALLARIRSKIDAGRRVMEQTEI